MNIRYFIFDIESAADPRLVKDIKYPDIPDEELPPPAAVRRFRDELLAKNDSDFIPYTFQIPVSVTIAKVCDNYALNEIVVLDEPYFRPHEITRLFWRGWSYYKQPTLVSFNGRGFDIPLLELAAFRYGVSMPAWYALKEKTFEQPRNRYNIRSHLDLCDLLTNNGASRFNGGLNLVAHLIGKPGKMDTRGHMVQDLYEAGEIAKINDYCRCDVLDTYFAFLRAMVVVGSLPLDEEQRLVHQAKDWIGTQTESPAYRLYLDNWGDWVNPWNE
ncbi:MAG TPA: 3'-5' exonuclease [Planctomycetaceae bacterium]|nr:3'-5' exonuclease [Planctomycetaceae bacterium]